MSEIIHLADKRPPTVYVLDLTHHWDGTLEVFVRDIPDDERSRKAVLWALQQAVAMFADPEPPTGNEPDGEPLCEP